MATSKSQSQTKGRKRSQSAKKTPTTATANSEFTCPECGRTFTRAASLGAHRNRAHGVAGRSAQATKRRAAAPAARTGTRGRKTQATRRRTSGANQSGARDGINRDALLTALFPNGMPAREEVIRAAGEWL